MILYILIVLIIIAAVLLTLIVLAQSSKGGVGTAFGGGASQMMGVKKTGDILEKLTWGFIIAIVVLCVSVTVMFQPAVQQQQGLQEEAPIEQGGEGAETGGPAAE